MRLIGMGGQHRKRSAHWRNGQGASDRRKIEGRRIFIIIFCRDSLKPSEVRHILHKGPLRINEPNMRI